MKPRKVVALLGNLEANSVLIACDDGTLWVSVWDGGTIEQGGRFTWVEWQAPVPGTLADIAGSEL